MPAGKRRQSNAMLYTLVTFIGLFIAATTVAVIYYVKAEEFRTTTEDLQDQLVDFANSEESRNISQIIGSNLPRQTHLGTMVQYLNQAVQMVVGTPLDNTTAEVKVEQAKKDMNNTLATANQYLVADVTDPNSTIGLTAVIRELKNMIDNLNEEKSSLQQAYNDQMQRFETSQKLNEEEKQQHTKEKQALEEQLNTIETEYERQQDLLEQTADERVQALLNTRNKLEQELEQTNTQLLQTQAALSLATDRMNDALEQLRNVEPVPDANSIAYKIDGKIVLVDKPAGIVRLNIGSKQKVYIGLAFSVFDQGVAIPKEGKPKAKIKVTEVFPDSCFATIVEDNNKNPISNDDIVINMIWDSNKISEFVIVGDFDLNNDGTMDFNGATRLAKLIQEWGGSISNEITANTDYIIMGNKPKALSEPTIQKLDIDPDAQSKYEYSVTQRDRFEAIINQAKALWIPIFSYDTFLYLIGYTESQLAETATF